MHGENPWLGVSSFWLCATVYGEQYLDRGFAGDVGDQEVHCDVFAVHVSVHPVLDVSWHLICVEVVEVLGGEKNNKIISKIGRASCRERG